jgi:hypothetical protein
LGTGAILDSKGSLIPIMLSRCCLLHWEETRNIERGLGVRVLTLISNMNTAEVALRNGVVSDSEGTLIPIIVSMQVAGEARV